MTRRRILVYFVGDLVGSGLFEVLKAYRLLGKARPRSWLGPLAWWGVAGGILIAVDLGVAAGVWFLAIGTSFWGFNRIRTWTEHVGTDSTHRVSVNWWQRLLPLPHCSWSHLGHHRYPSIPFWRRGVLRPRHDPGTPIGRLLGSFATPAPPPPNAPASAVATAARLSAARGTRPAGAAGSGSAPACRGHRAG